MHCDGKLPDDQEPSSICGKDDDIFVKEEFYAMDHDGLQLMDGLLVIEAGSASDSSTLDEDEVAAGFAQCYYTDQGNNSEGEDDVDRLAEPRCDGTDGDDEESTCSDSSDVPSSEIPYDTRSDSSDESDGEAADGDEDGSTSTRSSNTSKESDGETTDHDDFFDGSTSDHFTSSS